MINDIVTLLGQWLKFGQYGEETVDLPVFCPFHGEGLERTPSLYIYVGPDTGGKAPGVSFCHACNKGWNLYTLLADLQVPANLRATLLDNVKIPIAKKLLPGNIVEKPDAFAVCTLPEHILAMYEYCPLDLVRAGFDKGLLRSHDIGFDRVNNRITFPVRHYSGELAAIVGRATQPSQLARYKSYGKHELGELAIGYKFDKAKMLWRLERIYETVRNTVTETPVIICEGFKATLKLVSYGFPYTMSTFGASLSALQSVLLQTICSQIVLFYDNDSAGCNATDNACKLLTKDGIRVSVARYPGAVLQGESPDDLTSAEVSEAIEKSIPFVEWRNRWLKEMQK